MTPLLVLHAAVTLVLVGLIWTVQLAIYPLFGAIEPRSFAAYHAAYTRRITWLVAPLMGAELVTGLLLLERAPAAVPRAAVLAGALLIAVPWASTALVQVPLHARVAGARRAAAGARARLAATNWVRTLAWSARGVLVGWMCVCAAHGAA